MKKFQTGIEKVNSKNQTLTVLAQRPMLLPFVLLLVLSTLFSCLPKMGGKMSIEEFNREVNILQDSIMKQQQINSETYLLVSNIQSNQVSSTGIVDIIEKIYLIKERSDELDYYILDLMNEIIESTEQNEGIIYEPDEIDFAALRRINEKSIPHEILIGDENYSGKAYIVRVLLEEYKVYVSDILKDDPSSLEKLDKAIDIRQTIMDDDNNPMTWEGFYFANKSEGEALIELLHIQASVELAETIAITYLYNAIIE